MYAQYAIAAIVLVLATLYAVRRAVGAWREAQSGCYGCKGCALKEQMLRQARHNRKHRHGPGVKSQKPVQNDCWQKK